MAQRINVGQPLQPKIVRPTAAPVDTFVQPRRDTNVEQIATALSQFVPSLSRFAGVLGEQKGAQDRLEGQAQADRMRAAGKTIAEEVRSGKRKPHESPWFRVGYYETVGRNSGAKYVGDFLDSLGKSAVKDSVELSDFDDFERRFRSEWITRNLGEDSDAFLMHAFGSTADGQISSLRNGFAQQAGSRMVKQNAENFHAEIFNEITKSFAGGSTPEQVLANIRLAQERQIVVGGMSYEVANPITVSAVAAAAYRLRDVPMMRKILAAIPTNPGSKGFLEGTSYGSETIEKMTLAINREIQEDSTRASQENKKNMDIAYVGVTQELNNRLRKNPSASIEDLVDELNKTDPIRATSLYAIQQQRLDGISVDNPTVLRELNIGIYAAAPGSGEYTTLSDLDRAYTEGNLTNIRYDALRAEVLKRDEAGGGIGGVSGNGKFLNNPVLNQVVRDTKDHIEKASLTGGSVDPALMGRVQVQAGNEAMFEMIEWLQANPEAKQTETVKQLDEIARRVSDRWYPKIHVSAGNLKKVRDVPVTDFTPVRTLSSPQDIATMAAQWAAILTQERGRFDPRFETILRNNGIDPTRLNNPQERKNIQTLIDEQKKLLNLAPKAPPVTSTP